jgi:hypothetical protein
MPPITEFRWGFISRSVVVAIGVTFLCLAMAYPAHVGAAVLALLVLYILGARRSREKMAALAAARPSGNGICGFARSFNLRETDSWVVRAVYEELQGYLHGTKLTVCADDDLTEGLDIDPEDLEESLVDIAHRARRSLTGYEANPHYGSIRTARDLVAFLNAQPRVA